MEKTNSLGIPVVTLSNGLRVANFSSPHNFNFVDGNILLACSPERAKQMELICKETEEVEQVLDVACGMTKIKVTNLLIEWQLSSDVANELQRLLWDKDFCNQFDVLLVPLPVMTALKAQGQLIRKARCVRMSDRVTKAAHIDRFCI